MMPESLADRLAPYSAVLMEGAVIERLKRETPLELDPLLLNTPLIYDAAGRAAMAGIYTGYITIAGEHGLPILVAAPTWRANAERIGRRTDRDVATVNREAVDFVRQLAGTTGKQAAPVIVGGLMACRGDAYRPEAALSADAAAAFHAPQARALADAGVEFIMAATLPALSEAMGMAELLANLPVAYIVSFVLGPAGTLLDGTDLKTAITLIDRAASRPPAFYMVNCVHPQTLAKRLAMEPAGQGAPLGGRLLGIQANTSTRAPDELDGREALDGASPDPFADMLADLNRRHDLKIIGGCCGTDHRHIAAVARRLTPGAHAV